MRSAHALYDRPSMKTASKIGTERASRRWTKRRRNAKALIPRKWSASARLEDPPSCASTGPAIRPSVLHLRTSQFELADGAQGREDRGARPEGETMAAFLAL